MLTFKAVKRNIPGSGNDKHLYYAALNRYEKVGITQLAQELSRLSSVSKGDVTSVLTDLSYLIPKLLAEGKSVQIGELGTFFLTLNSEGKPVPGDVDSRSIKAVRFRFRFNNSLRALFGKIIFKKLT